MNSRRNFIKATGLLTASSILLPSMGLAEVNQQIVTKIKPPMLKPGDTVAITSPAGAVWDEKQITVFGDILISYGFKVIYGQTLKEKFGYFAGTDELRAQELNDLFANKQVKGIFCMKGGWGSARILEKIGYNIIQKNPKVFVGFSDISALLLAIAAKTGLVTFHGPVGTTGWNDFTKTSFMNVAMTSKVCEVLPAPAAEEKFITITKGKVSGELVGGNLTIMAGLMGSNYVPEWRNKILFLEESKEEPYSVDRMLTQLKLSGVLDTIAGFVFGKCVKCEAEEPLKAFTLHEVLLQRIQPLGIPAFYGAMIGHIENKLTIPIGIKASMDADKGTLSFLESAVI